MKVSSILHKSLKKHKVRDSLPKKKRIVRAILISDLNFGEACSDNLFEHHLCREKVLLAPMKVDKLDSSWFNTNKAHISHCNEIE